MFKKVDKKILARWKNVEIWENLVLLDVIMLENDLWAYSLRDGKGNDLLHTRDGVYFKRDYIIKNYPTSNIALAATGSLGCPHNVYIGNNNGNKYCVICGKPTKEDPGFSHVYHTCNNPECDWYKN